MSLDPMPFTRIIWKERGKKIQQQFGELVREAWLAELKTVSEGMRNCATFHLRSENYMDDMELLEEMGLVFKPINIAKRVGGFAHKFYSPSQGEPFDIYGVVAKDINKAREFKKASGSCDHSTIGKLLNYPTCCVRHFNKVWPRDYDPVYSAAKATDGSEENGHTVRLGQLVPEANMALRYFGLRAVPHLVCSFTCGKSKEFAQMFMHFISRRKKLLELLEAPFTWSCYRGVAIVDTPNFVGVSNSMPYAKEHKVAWDSGG